jgi:hypothetical protein
MTDTMEASDFVALLQSPAGIEHLLTQASPAVHIVLNDVEPNFMEAALASLAPLPIVVIGLAASPGTNTDSDPSMALADLVIDPEHKTDENDNGTVHEHIEATLHACPTASVALALLLRGADDRSIPAGLVAESSTYSLLQAGSEFQSWKSTRPRKLSSATNDPVVKVDRQGNVLHVTLSRPHKHNAVNAAMQHALYEAFTVAATDPTLTVQLTGEGPSFCAGGDLDEFGSFTNPASAHLVRLERSVGRLISTMSERVTTVLHGACLGAGIELPAFGTHVVARPDARIGLPEVGLGLIPGAGGTVSVTQRIGRQRTAWLALSGLTIDAPTALAWGLVDELTP